MATDVSICSNALLMIGDKPINALNDESDAATLAANLYPQVRLAVLRSHPWNCAVKRIALAPEVTTPVMDWAYQFSLPSDYIRVLQVGQAGAEDDHQIEGLKILADTNPLYLRYIFANTNEATWDSMLVHGVSLAMAAAMAYPLTKSTSLAESMLSQARDYLKQCRAVDGQDNPPDTFGDFPLLRARGGSPSSWSW